MRNEDVVIVEAKEEDHAELITIWEASVRATHDFLEEQDILGIRPVVADVFKQMDNLVRVRDGAGRTLGFMGISQRKIEMLFLHPSIRGKGIGKRLIAYATGICDAVYVDVNEQNKSAVGFYEHLGFKTIGRDAEDSMGRPFPILHMQKKNSI